MSGTNRPSERCRPTKEPAARKPYVQPKLAKREKLIEVTGFEPMPAMTP